MKVVLKETSLRVHDIYHYVSILEDKIDDSDDLEFDNMHVKDENYF